MLFILIEIYYRILRAGFSERSDLLFFFVLLFTMKRVEIPLVSNRFGDAIYQEMYTKNVIFFLNVFAVIYTDI